MNSRSGNSDIFLVGKHVILKALSEQDARESDWYGWFNDPETTYHLQKHYYPNTRENQVEFWKQLSRDKSIVQLGVSPADENRLVGIVSIQSIDFINSNAEIAMVMGDPDYRHLIHAQEVMQLVIEHAFYTLNLHRVYLGYIETLAKWGEFLKRRFGFREEGVLRDHVYKRGEYLSVHRLGLLKSEYNRV